MFAVIVEEAAEALEAHIVANLNEHTEHLILIGKFLGFKFESLYF